MNQKEQLQGHKIVKVCTSKFVIRRINPLLDFNLESMPQIFSSFQTRRKTEKAPYDPKLIVEQMMRVVEKGLVSPELVPVGVGDKRGKEDGITVEDIFRDEECGFKLYSEIMFHSLNKFSGLKKVFFSMKLKAVYYINLLKLTADCPAR
jgi:hypothetical protein